MKIIKRIIKTVFILAVIVGALAVYFKFMPTVNVKYFLWKCDILLAQCEIFAFGIDR